MKVSDLRVEYQKQPMGMDVKKPKFSWVLASEHKEVVQSAYQIVIKKDYDIIWDSGEVESDQSIHLPYMGKELLPCSVYDVSVKIWNNHNEVAVAGTSFETGLMDTNAIKAQWITHNLSETTLCPIFVKEFKTEKEIKRARLYASALGVYEIEINQEKVGDAFFAPGWTSYHHRLQYQTYDISKHLKRKNRIEITVANGWYKGLFGFNMKPDHYGKQLAVLAELHIEYMDGSSEIIPSDLTWTYTTGPIQMSEIYLGETYDANEEQKANDNLQALSESPALAFEGEKPKLVAQENEPVRITERFSVVKQFITPKGEVVLDFGQNLAGFVEMKVDAPKGTRIKLRHAEVLDKEGNFYTENLRGAISVDEYISSGKEAVWHPRFTFHGFRYVCVEGLDEVIAGNFTACSLHSDMEKNGEFSCSDERVNRLQKNIEWGLRSNFLDVPTDCPQRDERLGWTGDAQVFARTAAFNRNVALFFKKWLRDLRAEQTMEFGVPSVVPNILGDQAGAAAWGDAATIIPWVLYETYGDKELLAEQYSSMRDWVDYIKQRAEKGLLWQCDFQYADWLALDKEEMSDRVGATDRYLVATAFYAHSTQLLYQAAQVLGYDEDYAKYKELFAKIKEAFNEEYITKTGRVVSETQTGCVLSLHFDLAFDQYKERIFTTLQKNIAAHANHLVTGFVGTPYINHVLSDFGDHELAGKIMLKDDFPSWLYAVKMGATTVWERWDSMKPDGSFDESGMNSFNHYAYGSIGDWLYQKVAGITSLEPAYKRIRIAPRLTVGFSRVSAWVNTMYGKISCSYLCEDGKIKVDIEIPVNTTAEICLPEKAEILYVGSGSYHFEYETSTLLELQKYSMESTLGQILAIPRAIEMLEQFAPGMSSNPMIKFAYGQTIGELTAMMPAGGDQMFLAVIAALNEEEK